MGPQLGSASGARMGTIARAGYLPKYTPEYYPNFLDGENKAGSGTTSSYGSSSYSSYSAPASAPAYSMDMSQYSPEQRAFLERKFGGAPMSGGLDTHGRPRH